MRETSREFGEKEKYSSGVVMVTRITVFLIIVFFCRTLISAEEQMLDSLKNSELVELLASKNPPPEMIDQMQYEIARYPKGYDHNKQYVVFAAADELRKRGVKAFPDLIRAIDDQRYSCLRRKGEVDARKLLTVGKMSWWIISSQVHAWQYAFQMNPELPSLEWNVPNEKKALIQWLESRKGWTLNQFQKEAIMLNQKMVNTVSVYDESERKEIFQQLDKVNQQLIQPENFFEVFRGVTKKDDELLFYDVDFKVKLKTNVLYK